MTVILKVYTGHLGIEDNIPGPRTLVSEYDYPQLSVYISTDLDSFLPRVSPLVLYDNVGSRLEMRAVRELHVCNQVSPEAFHCLRSVV